MCCLIDLKSSIAAINSHNIIQMVSELYIDALLLLIITSMTGFPNTTVRYSVIAILISSWRSDVGETRNPEQVSMA